MSEQLHPERRPHSDRIREELGPLVDEEGRVIREITDYEASFWGLYPEVNLPAIPRALAVGQGQT